MAHSHGCNRCQVRFLCDPEDNEECRDTCDKCLAGAPGAEFAVEGMVSVLRGRVLVGGIDIRTRIGMFNGRRIRIEGRALDGGAQKKQ